MENRKYHFSAFKLAAKDLEADTTSNPQRVVTVIDGIPFYCSTGRSSKHAGTWLPFLGLREKTNWIVKPGKINATAWPAELTSFIDQLNSEEFTFQRLGSLQTMCISASLNSGYWLTEKGEELKSYLSTNFPQCFLNETQVAEINRLESQENLVELPKSLPEKINVKLKEMGAIAILNSTCRLLPLPAEKALYENENSRNLMVELDKKNLLIESKDFLSNESFRKASWLQVISASTFFT